MLALLGLAVYSGLIASGEVGSMRALLRNTVLGKAIITCIQQVLHTRKTLTPPLLPPCVFSRCTLVRSSLLMEFSNRDSCGAVTCKTLGLLTLGSKALDGVVLAKHTQRALNICIVVDTIHTHFNHTQKNALQVPTGSAQSSRLAHHTHPMDTINRTAVDGLLQHLVVVHLLRHHSGPAKVWLHFVRSRAHSSAVLTANACQLIHEHLHTCTPH